MGFVRYFGQVDSIRSYLGPHWATVLSFKRKQFVELVQEFYATFRHMIGNFEETYVVSFSLGRQLFEISVHRFAVVAGLYTEAEAQTRAFRQSVRGITTVRGVFVDFFK